MILKYTPSIAALSLLFFFIGVEHASAARVEFVISPDATAGVAVVEARIDPEGSSLNAIEGSIGILGTGAENVSSVLVETGGSLFALWPVQPTYSQGEGVIRFTGGTPEAFSEDGLLFRIRIFSKKAGDVTVSWLGGSAYRDDGEGTAEGISSRSLTIALAGSEPSLINASTPDSQPPYFDTVLVSEDADTHEGKYFVVFHATDDISGVVRYEVVEGGVTTVANEGMYVLHDQERDTKVIVIAYDGAGNSTSVKVPLQRTWVIELSVLIGILLMLTILFVRRKPRQKSIAR